MLPLLTSRALDRVITAPVLPACGQDREARGRRWSGGGPVTGTTPLAVGTDRTSQQPSPRRPAGRDPGRWAGRRGAVGRLDRELRRKGPGMSGIVDVWMQHPTLRHSNHEMFASLRRWMGVDGLLEQPIPLEATIAAMDEGGVDVGLTAASYGPE